MEKKQSYLPDVWHDDTRMSVLFAPFREKSLNPSSWKQKMTFWIQIITEECINNQISIIDIGSLQTRFTRNGKVPLCLDVVIDEMIRSNTIRKLANNTNSPVKQKSSWLSWGYDTFLKTPVTWGVNYLSANNQPPSKDVKYVMVEILSRKCDQIVERHYCGLYCDVTDSLIDYSQLWKKSQMLCDTETEFILILEELVKQKKIAIYHENSQNLIKFTRRDEHSVKPVSKMDIDIFRIKKTRDMLTDRIDSLSSDIDSLKKEALRLKRISKTQALRCLRQKKLLEKRIDKLTGSLDTLDNILDQIVHSVSDEMVVKALESGNSVLKTLTDKTSADYVAGIMDDLSEVLEQQAEIQDQLSFGPSGLDVSKDELEAELEEMMKEDTKDKVSDLSIDNIISGFSDLHLPSVPIVNPEVQVESPQMSQDQNKRMSKIQSEMTSPILQRNCPILRTPVTITPQTDETSYLSPASGSVSSEKFDLSLELPDVPSFLPVKEKDKLQTGLNL